MRKRRMPPVRRLAWAALGLLAGLAAARAVRADEPWLAIRLIGGESACYPVSEVQRVGFTDDSLVVFGTAGSQGWGVASVARIEFLWDPANSGNPAVAAALVKAVHLFQSQPNPFSSETKIAFDVPQSGPVELAIYGVDGRLLRRLVNETRPAGRHIASWDGLDDAGERVGSGIYFYQLVAQGVEESRRMILLP